MTTLLSMQAGSSMKLKKRLSKKKYKSEHVCCNKIKKKPLSAFYLVLNVFSLKYNIFLLLWCCFPQ